MRLAGRGPGCPSGFRNRQPLPVPPADSVDGAVAVALALLRASTVTAAEDVARLDFFQASDFAEGVEDLSRVVEYLQIIGAARVDRARREAAAVEKAPGGWGSEPAAGSAGGWLTGWNQEPGEGAAGGDAKPGNESDGVNGAGAEDGAAPHGSPAVAWGTSGVPVPAAGVSATATARHGDGYGFGRGCGGG